MTPSFADGDGSVERHATLSIHVASALRQRIVQGQIADGTMLPRQEDLQAEFEVGHPSLREALRILEADGLVSVRRGKYGGAIVHSPKPENAAFGIGLVLENQHTKLDDVGRVLASMDPECAALCAERPDRESTIIPILKEIHRANRAESDPVKFFRCSREFHDALTANCGSNTLALIVGALEALWSVQILPDAIGSLAPNQRERALTQHEDIMSAISAGDSDLARQLAHVHMNESLDSLYSEKPAPIVHVSGGSHLTFAKHARSTQAQSHEVDDAPLNQIPEARDAEY
jgi:DNA-binding FadR family transcriptional regulator